MGYFLLGFSGFLLFVSKGFNAQFEVLSFFLFDWVIIRIYVFDRLLVVLTLRIPGLYKVSDEGHRCELVALHGST